MNQYRQALISKADLSHLIKDAFLSPPWYEELSGEECDARASSILAKKNVQCFIAEIDNDISGAVLTDTLSVTELARERGVALADWVSQKRWGTIG